MENLTVSQKRDIPFQVKSDAINNFKEVDTSTRTVDLIANTYYYFDTDQDVLINGVAAKSIEERGPNSQLPGKIKHAWHHDLKETHAIPKLIEETKHNGMDVLRANSFFPEVEDSERELIKYKEGFYDQHSIGFRYMQLEFIESETSAFDEMLVKLINPQDAIDMGYMYVVKEIKLYEYSTVAFGANRLTPYLGSKSENKTIRYNNFIKKLDALHNALREGIKDKYALEAQEQQIKQMISELYNQEPSVKDTLPKPSKDDTFDIDKYLQTIKFLK